MGGHAKRHWGNVRYSLKDYSKEQGRFTEVAEEELKELDE